MKPLFADAYELEHVLDLLEDFVATVKRYGITGQKFAELRANSALPVLERRLREALLASGIAQAHELADWNELNWLLEPPSRLSVREAAYARALRAVFSMMGDADDWHEALPTLREELAMLHAVDGDVARDERDRLRDGHRRGPEHKLEAASRMLRAMYRAAYRELHRALTASELIAWGKAKGMVKDLGSDLRLKMPDGKTSTISNDMRLIGNRLRSLKRQEGP